jgi:hypothetical protein
MKVGDIFLIPIDAQRFAYGQFVYGRGSISFAPLVQIFKYITSEEIERDISRIIRSGPLFPPVCTGVGAAIRAKLWRIIGSEAIVAFVYPTFISPMYDPQVGKVYHWSIFDGKFTRVGEQLPENMKKKELMVTWSPHDLSRRITTGELPFPYKELIEKNGFTPKQR